VPVRSVGLVVLATVLAILALTPGRSIEARARPPGRVAEVLPPDQTSLPYAFVNGPCRRTVGARRCRARARLHPERTSSKGGLTVQ
jgi:hypothetical protein